jgi:UTP--glucose-1-phosphate uridylyltransferase
MRLERLPEAAIEMFTRFYEQLAEGKGAIIPESDLDPVKPDEIEDLEGLRRYEAKGFEALKRTVIIKLNGGLGTTMGLRGPKSLIRTKKGLSFLDISIGQAERLSRRLGLGVPLVFMNSFFTETLTRKALESYGNMHPVSVMTFLQHKFPKVLAATLEPASSPSRRLLEWNPAGHGDLLLAMETSGLLKRFLDHGYRYLFVSNIDNLSAQIDAGILGYFHSERMDFLMEVTDRTDMDRKGGHLARMKNGRLVLREASQCDHSDRASFGDIDRHPFFNTNNLWINLESVQESISRKKYMDSSFIINRKKLDPLDSLSPDVYQLESALGSAIALFEQSAAVRVPRSRFTPVKNCEDILLLWSDYYSFEEDFRIGANPACRSKRPIISLDSSVYSGVDSLEMRFPHGAPSLVDCESFSVKGDVKFGRNVVIHGAVSIVNNSPRQITIEDDTEITEDLVF